MMFFKKKKIAQKKHKTITDKVSQYFTPALLLLAFGALIFGYLLILILLLMFLQLF